MNTARSEESRRPSKSSDSVDDSLWRTWNGSRSGSWAGTTASLASRQGREDRDDHGDSGTGLGSLGVRLPFGLVGDLAGGGTVGTQ